MRDYPHKPDPAHLGTLRADKREACAEIEEGLSEALAERNDVFFSEGRRYALELAALEYAFEAPLGDVRALLSRASAHSAQAIALGYRLGTGLYLHDLCLARLAKNDEYARKLEGMEAKEAKGHDAFFRVCELLADLSARRKKSAKDRLPQASRALASETLTPGAKARLAPIVAIAEAILSGDKEKLNASVEGILKSQEKFNRTQDGRDNPLTLLEIPTLGLLAIAGEYGLATTVRSVYLPLSLLE
jgi:hypothetical protein